MAALALTALAGLAALPAEAAVKKKPKPIKGSYALTLAPDPTGNLAGTALPNGCTGLVPAAQDQRPFTVPARGTLRVVLHSEDPTGGEVTDWDIYVLDADGAILSEGTSGTSHEEVAAKFKKKERVTFWVCNLAGQPSGTVSYTFTYA